MQRFDGGFGLFLWSILMVLSMNTVIVLVSGDESLGMDWCTSRYDRNVCDKSFGGCQKYSYPLFYWDDAYSFGLPQMTSECILNDLLRKICGDRNKCKQFRDRCYDAHANPNEDTIEVMARIFKCVEYEKVLDDCITRKNKQQCEQQRDECAKKAKRSVTVPKGAKPSDSPIYSSKLIDCIAKSNSK